MKVKTKKDYRVRRHMRIRKKISGTSERPRMAIMISNKYMYVQFIDDVNELTLASASTHGVDKSSNNVAAATDLGQRAAKAVQEKGVKDVVVDRAGFRFQGRVKAIVDGLVGAGVSVGKTLRSSDEEK